MVFWLENEAQKAEKQTKSTMNGDGDSRIAIKVVYWRSKRPKNFQ